LLLLPFPYGEGAKEPHRGSSFHVLLPFFPLKGKREKEGELLSLSSPLPFPLTPLRGSSGGEGSRGERRNPKG